MIIIILSFRVSTSKNKNADHRVKETCAIYVFYCNIKEKDHIRRNIDNKKKKCLYEKSALLLL